MPAGNGVRNGQRLGFWFTRLCYWGVGIEGICFHNNCHVTYVMIYEINVQLGVNSVQIGAVSH